MGTWYRCGHLPEIARHSRAYEPTLTQARPIFRRFFPIALFGGVWSTTRSSSPPRRISLIYNNIDHRNRRHRSC
jgi:hypothetical protein